LRFSLVNEHNTQPAYFDDFEIVHKPNADKLSVTSWAEYYAFGKVAKASCPSSGSYRYGYQGEFAEKDGETDWNSFELRQYDSEIGRFTTTDPMGEFWSSYVGMGNDPSNLVDPTGGETKDIIYLDKNNNQIGREADQYGSSKLTYFKEDANGSIAFGDKCFSAYNPSFFEDFGAFHQALTMINEFNPVANIANAIKGYFTGRDFNGQPMDGWGVASATASAIPISKAAAVTKMAALPFLIKSYGQVGLRNPKAVDALKKSMLDGSFDYTIVKGKITGYYHQGMHIISDGHHRVVAAIEIFKEKGNAEPLLNLIKNGNWRNQAHPYRPMPSRDLMGKFRNWLGF
jgi:RHS repeat-associated protein